MDLKQTLLDTGAVINSDYLDKYINLINANLNTPQEPFKTQKHHIIPQHIFKYNNKEIDNSPANLVNLKFSDHLLAHYYLMKCAATTKYELANANAIIRNINNPHTEDLESWINNNADLLQDINKRRCELISLHHTDVSGTNNPRATKVYKYSLSGELLKTYSSIGFCATDINFTADNLRAMLSRNRLIIIDDVAYSKYNDISLSEILDYINYKKQLADKKRYPREFTCDNCGKAYTLLLSDQDYADKKDKHHYCYDCTKTGINSRGIPKSEEHKMKISQAAIGRKWIFKDDQSKQVKPDELDTYLANGWQLGQSSKQIASRWNKEEDN